MSTRLRSLDKILRSFGAAGSRRGDGTQRPPTRCAIRSCYNLGMRECPLCGESMRLSERDVEEKNGTRHVREWICPECDYFEEAEVEG